MIKVKLLKWLTVSIVIFGALLVQQQVRASMVTYSNESTYTLTVDNSGPLNAPFSGLGASVNVGGVFTVTPGPGVTAIGVGNVIGDTLPTNLGVSGPSLSDLDFSFVDPQNTFGFTVVNWTRPGYVGASTFEVTIFNGTTNVGSTTFNTPPFGEVFFGFESSLSFNSLTLREIIGDIHTGTLASGAIGSIDREWFGKFYVTPIPSAVILGGLGLTFSGWLLKRRNMV